MYNPVAVDMMVRQKTRDIQRDYAREKFEGKPVVIRENRSNFWSKVGAWAGRLLQNGTQGKIIDAEEYGAAGRLLSSRMKTPIYTVK